MRIGFCSIYSWRPHTEHLQFLAKLVQSAGHEAHYLTCDSDLPACYSRELRPSKSRVAHCFSCRVGGVRSYSGSNVSSIGLLSEGNEILPEARIWSRSSASTLGRFESDEDYASLEFAQMVDRLAPSVSKAYAAAVRWIALRKLDAICVFNGRMDATRAILEAARSCNIRGISVERTWFGDGLQLLPDENCLGLNEVHRLVGAWSDKALTALQASRAASHVALRFVRRNTKEWRAYNTSATVGSWPVANAQRRILLTPSSRNEFWFHPDWQSRWRETTEAYDAIMARLGLAPTDLLLRCHPNWGEKIGSRYGTLSEDYYSAWARSRGVQTIPSLDSTSTLGLIQQADAIVVGGGSAALEAAILGKQVIATNPSLYERAGCQTTVYGSEDLERLALDIDSGEHERDIRAGNIARLALRFCHSAAYRVPQFVRFVRCESTTKYKYIEGADSQRLMDLIRSGRLQPDDESYARDEREEDAVLEAIRTGRWDQLASFADTIDGAQLQPVHRRLLYRPIDKLRSLAPIGDR